MLLETYSHYQYLPGKKNTNYNLILDIVGNLLIDFVTNCHIYGLKGYELRVRLAVNWLPI